MKIGTNFARKASRGGLDVNYLEQIRILNATMVQKILNLPMPERERKDNSKKLSRIKNQQSSQPS